MTSFGAQRAAWIERICRDQNIKHLTFRVAFLLGTYLNRATGDAWPKQKTLAEELGVTVRAVQHALDDLAEAGHLIIEAGRGRSRTNRYRPSLPKNTNSASPLEKGKCEPPFAITQSIIRTSEPEKANNGARKGENSFAPMNLSNNSSNNLERETRARDRFGGKNQSTIPTNLNITTEHLSYAARKGYDEAKTIDMFETFKNHHTSKGTLLADWNAGWRVWVDNERKFRKPDDQTNNFL